MRLYHFTPLQFALSGLALRRLKIARIADLNDPFELLAADLLDPELRAAFQKVKEHTHANNGMLCFSKNWKNPLLWSHYADKHRGVCFGFDVQSDVASEIEYSEDRIKISGPSFENGDEASLDIMSRLLRTKFAGWKYEQEVRVNVKLDHSTSESGLYFYDFGPALPLREVILGVLCDAPTERIRSLVGPEVYVKKTKLALRKFEVIEDHP